MTSIHHIKLLSVKDFCREYGLSRASAYRLHDRGVLPFVKIGRATRIRVEDVEAWMRSLPVEGR